MTGSLARAVETAASLVLCSDAEDLQALAAAHRCFEEVVRDGCRLPDPLAGGRLVTTSADAARLVEKLILREIADTESAMKTVILAVREMQALLSGNAGSGIIDARPAAEPKRDASTPAEHAHVAIDAETALNPEDAPLAAEFIAEATTHVETAEANLLKLEETPDDPEAVNAIFRSFHTVKGVAGFLNLKQIGALAHSAENLLDLARKEKLKLAGEAVDVVLESIDLLKALLAALDVAVRNETASAVEPRLPALLERLHRVASGTANKAVAIAPVAAIAPTLHDVSPAAPPAVVVSPTASEQAPVSAPTPDAVKSAGDAPAAHAEATVKVSTERLDSLINMVGELVISQSMVSQDLAALAGKQHRILRNAAHLAKITRELQDLSMSMRMVPIQGVFQKMARVVRDTGRKAGKEVEFAVVGGETELDRNVVEAIGDPLVHMVRNSVDHGIEPPAERLAAGKSRAGRLELRARHQAGHILIEIVDDGRGLNTKKILKKAIENGIVKEGQQLSDQEIFQLIFAAGLSTAEKITDISGRGVGMDVVRKNVEALRGRIEIESTAGVGTTFSIRLPLTLAVIDGMVVRVGSERYILPITSIEQSLRPKREQLSTVQMQGEMCQVRDRLMPLKRLHRLFNVTPRTEDPTEALVVIVHDNQQRCCLLVDELLGQQQVVIKSLGESLGHVRGVSGGAILGDGSVSLILDVPTLMQAA